MRRLHRPFELLELATALAPVFNGTAEQFGTYVSIALDEMMSHAGLEGRCGRCLGSGCLHRKDGQITDCTYCVGGYELAQTITQDEFWDADTKATEAKK